VLPGLSVLGSYGDGFRSPQARSLAESETTPFTTVRSAEVGARYAHRQLAASIAGFRTWLSDDLVFDPTTLRNERMPATQRAGFSVDGSYKPLGWLHLTLNLTYTHAELRASADGYQRGDLVPYAPQLVGRGDFAATPVLGTWKQRKLVGQFGAGASYLARRPLPLSLWPALG
jgi:outer membrane cobalamin receptor